jgi:plastocyanin
MVASGTTHTITQTGFQFSPLALQVAVGDVVVFQWSDGMHNTVSITVPEGAESWSAPLDMANTSFTYNVTVAGAYVYQCTFHSPSMAGGFVASLPNNVAPSVAANLSVSAGTSANGQLFVDLTNATTDMATVTLVDITGRNVATLHHGAIADADFKIRHDIAAIQRGIYFVRFQEGVRVVTRKVLVQ